jgi:hypothetical protein
MLGHGKNPKKVEKKGSSKTKELTLFYTLIIVVKLFYHHD